MFKVKREKEEEEYQYPSNYAFSEKEREVDNAIFQISDKGTKEEKTRLLKILKNRIKILQNEKNV